MPRPSNPPPQRLFPLFDKQRSKPPTTNWLAKLDSYIPFPRIATYNVNSLSQYANTKSALDRRHNIIANIQALLKQADIVCLQETRLHANDYGALSGALPSCMVIHAPGPERRAGLTIIVSQKYHSHFDVSVITPDSLCEDSKGNLLVARFVPRNPGSALPFQVINVRLAPGQAHSAKRRQIKDIKRIEVMRHTFMLGDFNFVDDDDDVNDSPHSKLDAKTTDEWNDLISYHRLREAHQPVHTYYRYYEEDTSPSSSRLDRIYYSHAEPDLTLRTPVARIPHIPFTALRQQQRKYKGLSKAYTRCSDHTPVLLAFVSTAPRKNRDFNLPAWIFKFEGARDIFRRRWKERGTPPDPFEALKSFNAVARATAKEVLGKRKKADSATQLGKLSAAISLLRCIDAQHTSRAKKLLELPFLAPCLLHGRPDYERTTGFIKNIFASADYDSTLKTPSKVRPPIDKVTNASIIKQAKFMFPSTRARLTHLVLHEGLVTHPQRIARALRDAWQPIWDKRRDEASPQAVEDWLRGVPRIDAKLLPTAPSASEEPCNQQDPDATDTWPMLVQESILQTNDSTPGPDGIPFIVYRQNLEISVPLLLDCLVALSEGVEPPQDFNAGRLFAIPKDTTHKPDATRPIVVNNSSNRIIAKVITRAITPALQAYITQAQQGFIEGRQGGKHLRNLNMHYYTAMRERRLEYVLFLDTRKAFDSIDHNFIRAVLDKTGFPRWIQRVVAALLLDAWVIPVVAEATTVRIYIKRGVKQGCPLSPLLFVLCYDTLLRRLEAHDVTLVLGFADDLAIMASTEESIHESMRLLDSFRSVSGLGINENKTKVLPTMSLTERQKSSFLETSPWSSIQLTTRYKYLGVHIGLNLTNVMVFEEALKKLKARIRDYGAVIRYMPIHQRVILCNVFLLSLFSYHIEYCLAPYRELVLKVNGALQRLIVPFRGFSYVHLTTPRNQLGFHQPLVDLWALNVARLAQQGPPHHELAGQSVVPMDGYEYLLNDNWQSLRHDDHIRIAYYDYFKNWAPRDPNGNFLVETHATQKEARKQTYRHLVSSGWKRERYSEDVKGALVHKLAKWGIRANAQRLTRSISACIFKCLPEYYRSHLRLTWLRVLPTDRRLIAANMNPVDRRATAFHGTCYICGYREKGKERGKCADSIKHLYGSCSVAQRARSLFYKQLGLAPRNAHKLCHTLLGEPVKSNQSLLLNLALVFNYCLWDARTRYFRALEEPPPAEAGARWILKLATTRWNERVGVYRGKATHYYMDPTQPKIDALWKRLSNPWIPTEDHPGVPREVREQKPLGDELKSNLRRKIPR